MKRKWIAMATGLLVISSLVLMAAYQTRPYTAGLTAGTVVTDEDDTVTFVESALIHYPANGKGGLIQKGQPCLVGTQKGLVGVALQNASANTDYIVVQRRGIWNLTTTNTAAMAVGDTVYIDGSDGQLSDAPGTDGVKFGLLLSAISGTGTGVVRPILVTGHALAGVSDLTVGDALTVAGTASTSAVEVSNSSGNWLSAASSKLRVGLNGTNAAGEIIFKNTYVAGGATSFNIVLASGWTNANTIAVVTFTSTAAQAATGPKIFGYAVMEGGQLDYVITSGTSRAMRASCIAIRQD